MWYQSVDGLFQSFRDVIYIRLPPHEARSSAGVGIAKHPEVVFFVVVVFFCHQNIQHRRMMEEQREERWGACVIVQSEAQAVDPIYPHLTIRLQPQAGKTCLKVLIARPIILNYTCNISQRWGEKSEPSHFSAAAASKFKYIIQHIFLALIKTSMTVLLVRDDKPKTIIL